MTTTSNQTLRTAHLPEVGTPTIKAQLVETTKVANPTFATPIERSRSVLSSRVEGRASLRYITREPTIHESSTET